MLDIKRDLQNDVLLLGPNSCFTVTHYEQPLLDFNPDTAPNVFTPPPYVGLSSFTEQQTQQFFGRQALISQLWEKFRQLHLPQAHQKRTLRVLPLLGPKAIGKSSVVRAGLLPALAQRPLNGLERVHVLVMQPSAHPLRVLSQLLARVLQRDPLAAIAETRLMLDLSVPEGLSRIVPALLDDHAEHVILCVDQFEELFSLCRDEEERRLFIDNLLLAAADSSANFSLVLTLDSEFLPAVQQHRLLYQTCARQGMLVTMLRPEELREAITEPALQMGQPLPVEVVEQLLSEFKDLEPSFSLPMLQFTLVQMWLLQQQGLNAEEALQRLDGISGALDHALQDCYAQLTPEETERFWRVLPRLLQLNDQGQWVCPRETVEALSSRQDRQSEIVELLQPFAQLETQIVRLTQSERGTMVRLVRPVLLTQWSLLRTWQRQQREQALFQFYVNQSAREWERRQRPPGWLWSSGELSLLARYPLGFKQRLSALQSTFVEQAQRRQQHFTGLKFGLWGILAAVVVALSVEVHQLTLQVGEMRSAQHSALVYAEQMKQDRDFAFEQVYQTQVAGQLLHEELQKARLQVTEAQSAEELALRALDEVLEARLNGRKPPARVLAKQCQVWCEAEPVEPLPPSKTTTKPTGNRNAAVEATTVAPRQGTVF